MHLLTKEQNGNCGTLGNFSFAYQDNDELSALHAAYCSIDNLIVGFAKQVGPSTARVIDELWFRLNSRHLNSQKYMTWLMFGQGPFSFSILIFSANIF